MRPTPRSIVASLAAVSFAVAACSSGDDESASDTTTATATIVDREGSTVDTSPTSDPATPSTVATEVTTAPTFASSATSVPELAPIIEHVLVDISDVGAYSVYQRTLEAPYADPRPGEDESLSYDPGTTPCASNWTRNFAGDDDSEYRYLAVRACEFPDMSAADAYEEAFVERTTALDRFSEDFVVRERYDVGDWAGRRGETAEQDGTTFRHWNVGRRHGLRYFEVTARDALAESGAEPLLLELVANQDERLGELGVAPDTSGPGFVGLPERLSVDSLLLPWAELADVVVGEPIDSSSHVENDLDALSWSSVVESSRRQLEFENGNVWLEVNRFLSENDAARSLRSFVSAGEPIAGVAEAYRAVNEAPGFDSASLFAGDRRYDVDVTEGLEATTGRPLVEAVVVALASHLDGLGVSGTPEPTVLDLPDEPHLDLVSSETFVGLLDGWEIADVDVVHDPVTGSPMVRVEFEQWLERFFPDRVMVADYVLGIDRHHYVERFVPGVGTLEPATWKQRVGESESLNGDTGERELEYSPYFVRHEDEFGMSVEPDSVVFLERAAVEAPLLDRYDVDMEPAVEIGRRLAAAWDRSGDLADVRLVRAALSLTDPAALGRGNTGSAVLLDGFEPDIHVVMAAPGASSPPGAVADWWRATDTFAGDDPVAATSWTRVVLFPSPAEASAHLVAVVGDEPEPVAGVDVGGLAPDERGGTFATVRGRWYFELVNHGPGGDPDRPFGGDADPTGTPPVDVLRALAERWRFEIDASGLG